MFNCINKRTLYFKCFISLSSYKTLEKVSRDPTPAKFCCLSGAYVGNYFTLILSLMTFENQVERQRSSENQTLQAFNGSIDPKFPRT